MSVRSAVQLTPISDIQCRWFPILRSTVFRYLNDPILNSYRLIQMLDSVDIRPKIDSYLRVARQSLWHLLPLACLLRNIWWRDLTTERTTATVVPHEWETVKCHVLSSAYWIIFSEHLLGKNNFTQIGKKNTTGNLFVLYCTSYLGIFHLYCFFLSNLLRTLVKPSL